MTKKQIRAHFGHNGVECRVRIGRDGNIYRFGSSEPTDRRWDFWAWVGHVADFAA